MQWQIIVALVVMVPIMLLPGAAIWYLNLGCPGRGLWPIRRGKQTKKETGG